MYSNLVQILKSRNTPSRVLGLENISQLCEKLGHPQNRIRAIHIAGTNGKGSVATHIAASIANSGYNVALYTSPHISTFRERICLFRKSRFAEPISVEIVEKYLPNVLQCSNQSTSYFEIVTGLAFEVFNKENVDFAVVECGLGGLLDATNVIEKPLMSVITSIGMDHVEILGGSIESITRNKAGIIKGSSPVVIGPNVPQHLVQEIAEEKGAPLYQVGASKSSLFGFKIQNQKIAKKGLEVLKKHHGIAISSEAMTLGLDTRPPCRFERRLLNPYTQVVLDVAHNKDGISHLLQEVQKLIHREKISKIEIICGFSKDKDFKSCVKLINEFISQNQGVKFNVSTVKAKHYRALDSSILQNEFNSFQSSLLKASSFPDVFSGVSNVMNSVTLSEKDRNIKRTLVLAFGSLFIMHDVRVALNLIDPNLSKHSDLEEHIYLNE